jgi:dynactin 1
LAERESGYVLTFDHDLDMFAASISLSRTSVAAIIKEEGLFFVSMQISLGSSLTIIYFLDVVIDMGGYNIDEVLFDPLGVFLTRCKSAKTLSK